MVLYVDVFLPCPRMGRNDLVADLNDLDALELGILEECAAPDLILLRW